MVRFICFFLIIGVRLSSFFFFFNDTATTEIYTLSLHDALPICADLLRPEAAEKELRSQGRLCVYAGYSCIDDRSEEHTSELQSRLHLVCRLLLEKKKACATSTTRPPRINKRASGRSPSGTANDR